MFIAVAFYRSHTVKTWGSSPSSPVRCFLLLCFFAADISTLSPEVQTAARGRMCAGTERAWASMEVWRTARVHVQVSRHFEKHHYLCVDIHDAKTVATLWTFSQCTQTNKQIQKIKTFTICCLTRSTLQAFVSVMAAAWSPHTSPASGESLQEPDWFSRLLIIPPPVWYFLKNWVTCHTFNFWCVQKNWHPASHLSTDYDRDVFLLFFLNTACTN